ncbi:hypothetical protein I5677_00635 [Mobilitalea sibirica]|uniref:Cytochrome b5 heme-binding domain-containing protein n=2 Tax=Mobilitalea sibirica TaxID=1462919 RepID=A0A8J7KZ52_9FIRM|nr:hypothetical protein [Mobilitalea sibirica]
MSHILNETQTKEAQLQVFTPQELAYYDGTEGKPIYVAVNNVVYDLSAAPAWVGGLHNGLIAGQDLTAQFRGCHQGVMDRLLKYPQAGFLRSEDI